MMSCGPILTLPPIKQGETFGRGGTVTGLAANVTGTCQINNPLDGNATVATLAIVFDAYVDDVTPRPYRLDLANGESTSTWPTGELRGDLKFTEADGTVIYSRTFIQPVVRAETP